MSSKPLCRWTVGRVSDAGYEVLKESVRITTRTLSEHNFDFMICCNNQTPARLSWLSALGVEIMQQKWDVPMLLPHSTDEDDRLVNGIWKVSPARVRPESHEIILDNDVILTNPIPALNTFMASTNHVLMLEDPLRWFGHYDSRMPLAAAINTGIIGLPPGYDFGADIKKEWTNGGSKLRLQLDDEQGLLALTLTNCCHKKSLISKDTVIELHPNGRRSSWNDSFKHDIPYKFTGNEGGFHFVEINRKPNHPPWTQFKIDVIKRDVGKIFI